MATLNPRLQRVLHLGWYLGLALLVTWPMALDPAGSAVGHPEASVGCHVWLVWWAGRHLGTGLSPLIFHPHGGDVIRLYGSDLLSPPLLGALPIPPALAYNLWVLLLLVGGGVGTDRLARRLGSSAGGALVGGTAFLAAPFFQHELLNGTSEMLAAAALPWFAAALLAALDRGGWRAGGALGIATGVAVGLSAYNLFFLLVVGGCLLVARLVTRREPVLDRRVLGALAAGALASAFFAVPIAILQVGAGASDTLRRRTVVDLGSMGDWDAAVLPDAYADLLAWFDPRDAVIPARLVQPDGVVFEYWTTSTVYLGLTVLALAAVGWWRRRRELPGVGLMVVVAALVASGPWLRVGGEALVVGGTGLPMPTLALVDLLPGFSVTALHAYRYAAVVVLGLSVLAAAAVRRPWWAMLVLADLWLLSPLPWPTSVTPVPDGPVLQSLAKAPEGAVLTLPMERDDLGDLGRTLLAQTRHGKPVQDGGIHRRAGTLATALYRDVPMLTSLSEPGKTRFPGQVEADWSWSELSRAGYRYVLARSEAGETTAWLARSLGPADEDDGSWALWVLEGR